MKLLIDTHAIIWYFLQVRNLTPPKSNRRVIC